MAALYFVTVVMEQCIVKLNASMPNAESELKPVHLTHICYSIQTEMK